MRGELQQLLLKEKENRNHIQEKAAAKIASNYNNDDDDDNCWLKTFNTLLLICDQTVQTFTFLFGVQTLSLSAYSSPHATFLFLKSSNVRICFVFFHCMKHSLFHITFNDTHTAQKYTNDSILSGVNLMIQTKRNTDIYHSSFINKTASHFQCIVVINL